MTIQYEKIYEYLRTSYLDPRKNRRLKSRDIHDIERIIKMVQSTKNQKVDDQTLLFVLEEIVRSYYVLEYDWSYARMYLKNIQAQAMGIPFVSALPDMAVPLARASTQNYRRKDLYEWDQGKPS